MLLILVFGISASFASADADSMQSNNNETLSVDETSMDDVSPESSIDSTGQNDNVENDEILGAAGGGADEVLSDSPGTFTELNHLIANSGTKVDLNKSYVRTDNFGSYSNYYGVRISTSSKTIDGHGYTLDSNNKLQACIFYVGSGIGTVTFKNIVFKNTYYYAVYFSSSMTKVDFINCTFMDNSYTALRLGAVTKFTMENCTFKNNVYSNTGSCSGAGIYFGGAVGSANFTNVNFTENIVKSTLRTDYYSTGYYYSGGAIYFGNTVENTLFNRVNFTGNKVLGQNSIQSYCGGAIYYAALASNVQYLNCTFKDNQAMSDGAAIYYAISASNVQYLNCTFKDNQAMSNGGAIYIKGQSLGSTFNDVTFISNTASHSNAKGDGGNIYVSGYVDGDIYKNVIITGTRIDDGAGLYVGGNLKNTLFDTVNISNVEAYRGLIYCGGNFENNNLYNVNFTSSTVRYGAVYVLKNVVGNVFNKTLFSNLSGYSGAGIYVSGQSDNNAFNDVNFTEITASEQSAAMYFNGIVKNTNFTGITVESNVGYSYGSVYFNSVDNVLFDRSSFINNTASSSYSQGGALVSRWGGSATFTNTVFIDNKAKRAGGAILIDSTGYDKYFTFENVNFTRNSVSASISVTTGNNYQYGGGAISMVGREHNRYYHVNFINNTAENSIGGAVQYMQSGHDDEYDDVNFTGNIAKWGGAISVQFGVKLTFSNSNFKNNKAVTGGALWISSDCQVSCNSSTFVNNTAVEGGAGYIRGFTAAHTFNGVKFINNTAGTGGALVLISTSNLLIDGAEFIKNAADCGGAIRFMGNSYNNYVDNSIFANNSAKFGGVLYADKGPMEFYNSSFEYNSAESDGILYSEGLMNFDLCNFTKNDATNTNLIYLNNANVTQFYFDVLRFVENKGTILKISGNLESNSSFEFLNDVWDGNYGGPLIIAENLKEFYIEDSNYTNNMNASVVLSNIEYCSISHVFIANNSADADGLINLANVSADVSYVSGENNSAVNGGVFNLANQSFMSVYRTDFWYNDADNGGVFYIDNSYLRLTDECIFINNTAEVTGGAIYSKGCCEFSPNAVEGHGSLFHNNTAGLSGGAIYASSDSAFSLNYCEFVGNIAGLSGGAIANIGGSSSQIDLVYFINNTASRGSAIDNRASISISNALFLTNKANATMTLYYNAKTNKAEITYSVKDNYINAINDAGSITLYNVTYFEYPNSTKNSDVDSPVKSYLCPQKTIYVEYCRNDGQVVATVNVSTDENGNAYAEYLGAQYDYIRAYTLEDDYYFATEKYALQGFGDFDILQNLISSNTNGTLDLPRDYTYTMGMDTITQGIIIDKPITINGNGHSIDALYQSRIFKLLSDDVTFNNVVFKNSIEKDGSFIYGENVNNTEINDCVFYNSGIPLSSYDGLGVCPVDEFSIELLFNDSDKFIPMFVSNVPYNYDGGAIYITGDGVSIRNSEFMAIAADIGGAVFIGGDHVTLDNLRFDHMVGYYGGAVYVNGKYVNIINSEFNTNIAGFSGGSILAFGSDYYIINSRFNDTYAFGVRVSPQTPGVIINPSPDPGSGRSIRGGNNVLRGHDNGGLVDPGLITTINPVDSNINISEFGGGAINIHASSVNILDSKFSYSVARAAGGAIFAEGIDYLINNCTFEYCYNDYDGLAVSPDEIDRFIEELVSPASPDPVDPGTLIGPDDTDGLVINDYYGGGAIFANVVNLYIDNSTFYKCNSSIGGAVCSYGENTNILNSNFTQCLAYSGGAVILIEKAIQSTINKCIFTNNVAKVDGGAVSGYANDVKILNCLFDSNSVIFDSDYLSDSVFGGMVPIPLNGGGAIYLCDSSDVIVSNSNFISNVIDEINMNHTYISDYDDNVFYGGAIFLSESVANITGCGFENNLAFNGGAIASLTGMSIGPRGQQQGNYGEGGEYGNTANLPDYIVNIENCEFANNLARYAGAVFTTGGNNNILNSKFRNNLADVAGAVYLKSSYDLIRNSTFDNNSALVGGAVVSGCALEVYDIVSSGKMDIWGYVTVILGELNEITDSTFTNNIAETAGAVLIIGNGSKISNSNFTDNELGTIFDRMFAIRMLDKKTYEKDLTEALVAPIQTNNVPSIQNHCGGAVYWLGQSGEIFNVTFNNNRVASESAASSDAYTKFVRYYVPLENFSVYDNFGSSTLEEGYVDILIDKYYAGALRNVTAQYGNAVGIFFIDSYTEHISGDIYNITLMYVFNVTVLDSGSEVSSGGAVYWVGDNGNVTESRFNNNSAGLGGAILWDGVYGRISDSTFNKNWATDGGAILLAGERCEVTYSNFTDNYVVNKTVSNIIFDYYPIYDYITNPSREINGVTYYHVEDFKRAFLYYYIISDYASQYDYVNVVIHEFTVDYEEHSTQQEISPLDSGDEMDSIRHIALDIELLCYNKTAVVDDSMSGGAIYVAGYYSDITFSRFENNTADKGGAIFISDEDAYVYESSFDENTANEGGAIYWSSDVGNIGLSNFTANSALNGGSLYCNGSQINVYVSNFINNSALNGGAIYWNGDGGTVSESNFTGNTADIGGAVYVAGNQVGFMNSNFYGNTAKFGGALYAKGYAGLLSSEFKNNKANFGSAVYVEYNDIYVESSTFLENQANSNSLNVSVEVEGRNIAISSIFTGNDNLINAFYVSSGFTFYNVTYWSSEGVTNSDVAIPGVTSREDGINITISIINVKYATEEVIINMTDVMGETTTVIPNVRSGKYYVIVSHEEDDYYTKIGNYDMIQVGTRASTMDIDVDDIFYRQNATVDITLDRDAVGNVTIWLNGEYYTYLNLTAGRASLNISDLAVGTYNVTVRYNGSEDYDDNLDTVEFKVKQINSTINVTTDSISNGASVPINITVGPYDDVTGKVFVTIEDTFGVTISIANSTDLRTVVTNLADGNYTIDVYYTGDNNYLPSSNSTKFTVKNSVIAPVSYTINATVADIDYLENATAYISISAVMDGSVIITVGEKQFTGTITGGKGTVNLTDLSGGLKTAYVNFTSANNRVNLTTETKFMVNPLPTKVDINVNGKSFTVNVTDGASGNLTVFINNARHEFSYAGTPIEFNDVLIYGNNTVVAVYAGNENYTGSQNITHVPIEKNDALVNVTADSITFGRDAVIIVNVGAGQSGYVTINVAGKDYTSIIDNTQIVFNIPGLEVDDYPVTVKYSGDNVYKQQNNQTSFSVVKANLSATVVGQNIYVIENSSFIIGVPANFNGTVNITVDGKKYSGEVKSLIVMDRLTPGSKIADIIFYGDRNYNDLPLTAAFTVSRMPTVVNVTVGDVTYPDNSTARINVSGNANGSVEITIDGNVLGTFNVVNGFAGVDLGKLSGGIKNLTAKFTVSDLINDNATYSTKFVVNQANSTVGIANEGTSVTVNVTPAVAGNLIVYVNGEKHDYVFDGTPVKLDNVLLVGNNTVMAVFEGNENYSSSQSDKVIEIPKNRASVNVSADAITYGSEAIITVRVGEGQGGHVTITVNNRQYTSEIRNNEAVFTIPGLNASDYPVGVTYSGDSNYENATNATTLTVNKADLTAIVEGQNITVNDNSVFVISNVSSLFKGYVNITVDGKTYSGDIKSLVIMDKLAAGNKTANVVFYGDDNYNDLKLNATFTVSRVSVDVATTMEVNVENVEYGANATAIITVSGNANGTVVVTINGQAFEAKEVVNGNAAINLGILSAGIKDVAAVFSVDEMKDSFNSNASDVTKFVVSKAKSEIAVTVDGANVTVNVVKGSQSTVSVYINGVKQEFAYGGKAIVLENVLGTGNNTVLAVYEENENFTSSQDQKDSIIIAKKAALVNVTAEAITYGSDAVIVVNVGENQSGSVVISVNGVSYTSIINGTQAIFKVPGLDASDAIAVGVTYSGDDTFENATNATTLKVNKADLTANVEGQNITVNDNSVFVISNVSSLFKGYVNITVDGKTYSGDVRSLVVMDKLTAGDKNATAIFYGDENYNALTLTDIKFTVYRVVPGISVIIPNVDYPDAAYAFVTIDNNANGTVVVTVDGKVFNTTVSGGLATVEMSGLSAGIKSADVKFVSNDGYNSDVSANYEFTVNKANSTLIIDVEAVYLYNETITINLTAVGSDGIIGVTINGKVYPVGAKGQVTIDNLDAGDYTIIANLASNENYTAASNSTTFKVKKVQSAVSIKVDSVYRVGDDIVIEVIPVNSTGAVNVTVNGKSCDVVSNKVTITGGLEANDYIARAVLAGDNNFEGSENSASFKVVKYDTAITLDDVSNVKVGTPVTFTARLNETVTGDVVFTINGINYVVSISNSNVASYEYVPANNGTVTVVAAFAGNEKYNGNVSEQKQLNVEKVPTSIGLTVKTPVTYGDNVIIVIAISPAISGAAQLNVDGKDYDIVLTDGKSQFNVSGLNAGSHEVKVAFAGDYMYLESKNATKFVMNKADLAADVTALNVTVAEDASFVIKVPDDYHGKVNITVDGLTYSGDVKSLVAVAKLTVGKKSAHVAFYGDENYNDLELDVQFRVTNSTVAELVTIKADDMVRGYNSEFDYQAAFLTEDGDALINAAVKFIVNGKEYEAVTDESGIAHLIGSKLAVGKYNVTIVNTVSGQTDVKKVEIVKRITENKDLTMDFWDGSKFRVKVYGDDGNVAPAGEIISITANGVHYVGKVDKNGYATLTIKLLPKKYTLVCEYKGYKTTNKLVVKQTLKPVKKVIKVKKSAKSFKIKATLKWSNGKAIKGKKIIFKFKGKTYKAKTNKKGVASVKIKKKVIKKLKKGKTYKVKITYQIKDKYGNGYVLIKDTVKCKVKVKK